MDPDLSEIIEQFPKRRPPLPQAYQDIYNKEYEANRSGEASRMNSLAIKLEEWMHRQVSKRSREGMKILEIGAGNLNHLRFEAKQRQYDIVEPFERLFQDSGKLLEVSQVYKDITDIQGEQYDRIFSIATLEHVTNLPELLTHAASLLADQGVFQAAIPSEGGFLWGAAWRMTTGISFYMRNRLDYSTLMRYEHINTEKEVRVLIEYCFDKVSLRRFPLPLRHLSFYTFIEASEPNFANIANLGTRKNICQPESL